MSEKSTQRDVTRLYQGVGAVVYDLSQPRATMQTPGLPDLWVFLPRKGTAFWHETKAPGGTQSPAQIRFEELCTTASVGYVCGGVSEAVAQLKGLGVLAA